MSYANKATRDPKYCMKEIVLASTRCLCRTVDYSVLLNPPIDSCFCFLRGGGTGPEGNRGLVGSSSERSLSPWDPHGPPCPSEPGTGGAFGRVCTLIRAGLGLDWTEERGGGAGNPCANSVDPGGTDSRCGTSGVEGIDEAVEIIVFRFGVLRPFPNADVASVREEEVAWDGARPGEASGPLPASGCGHCSASLLSLPDLS
jgi:hypothetical protein